MRVVGGRLKGRNLASPSSQEIRPTADRLRESVFNILIHAYDDPIEGARVLDLFAGTGGLGLEALSRGAKSADFVETRPSSLHSLKANIVALRMKDCTRVFKRDALPFADALSANSYDVAFADPPYESRMLDRVVERWQAMQFARVLVAEHAKTHILPKGTSRMVLEDTAVTFYRIEKPVSRG